MYIIPWVKYIALALLHGRAVARSENPKGHVVLGGDNVPPPLATGLQGVVTPIRF
jgi:hypothetical protein